ncbi:S1 RNA-binding domain-containing protein [Marinilactibacillus sp. GCM10026970]|uniref:CvfB family protein n=1 Tax=Marinilactibacillus sp. GCM10026970 TaxID=3252642 RepID=UPI00360DFE78
MSNFGNVVMGIVTDKNEKATFVQNNGVTYEVLAMNQEELELGQTIEGFCYVDKGGNQLFTTEIPEVRIGNFGWGEVIDIKRSLGVFVNVNWHNKDLVISLDDLPYEGHLWPKKGDKLYLTVSVDEQDRMWGQLAEEEDFYEISETGQKEAHNKDINGYAFRLKKAGTYFITEDLYIGFIHPSEREREPRLGEHVSGRIIGLREDGVYYVSMLPRAYEVLDDDAAMILEVLRRAGDQYIKFNDKSDPQAIKNQFGISKGQFKRALGRLFKQRLIEQDEFGTKLIRDPQEDRED